VMLTDPGHAESAIAAFVSGTSARPR
jgi:hypothetical protein